MSKQFSGELLRKFREQAGFTQMELAQKARYRSSANISRIESQGQAPRPRKIKAIARILKITPEQLYVEVPEEQTQP